MSSNPNIKPSNQAVLVATIDPDASTAATHTSDWVNMGTFEAIQAILLAGILGTGATIDFKLEQATDDSGTGAKDIAGKAIAQFTKASNDDDQAIINCRSDEVDTENNFTHVRCSMTVAGATSDSAALILGHYSRYNPATDLDSVVEVIG